MGAALRRHNVTFCTRVELLVMQQTDSQVVRRVVTGDREAFALLVDRYHARCLRVATHLLADADAADDAVQESFVRAYRHLGGYREQEKFGAWLMRILLNQCRTQSARERRSTYRDEQSVAALDLQRVDQNAVGAAADRRDELARALGQLPSQQREAVVLRFADELSFDEMSTVTGVGVSALKMRVQRACARLRAILAEHIHA